MTEVLHQQGRAPTSDDAETKALRRRWERNEGGIQAEFLDFEGFKAYEEANAKGLIKVAKRR